MSTHYAADSAFIQHLKVYSIQFDQKIANDHDLIQFNQCASTITQFDRLATAHPIVITRNVSRLR